MRGERAASVIYQHPAHLVLFVVLSFLVLRSDPSARAGVRMFALERCEICDRAAGAEAFSVQSISFNALSNWALHTFGKEVRIFLFLQAENLENFFRYLNFQKI